MVEGIYKAIKLTGKIAIASAAVITAGLVYVLATYSKKDLLEKLFILFSYRKVRLQDGKLLEGPDKVLGFGAFGTVARYQLNQHNVALKLPHSKKYNDLQKHEIELIKKASSHPNIMTYHDPIAVDGYIGIVMDLMGGTVRGLLEKNPTLSWKTKLSIAVQMTKGLVHLHNLDNAYISIRTIVHQDLKTDNLLVDRIDDDPNIRVKISDFGLARQVDQVTLPIFGKISSKLQEGQAGGTLLYTAPEVIAAMTQNKESCEPKSDVFSAGIILWELATTKRPNRAMAEINKGKFREFEEDTNNNQQRVTTFSLFGNNVTYKPTYPKSGFFGPIINKCIKTKVDDRPSASSALNDLQEIKLGLN